MKYAFALALGIAVVALGEQFGYLRAAIGVGVFAFLLTFGFRYARDMGRIPPDPEQTDVRDQGLKYVCSVCGLELRVEIAARDKAPNHCGEPMELIREGGVPLRPV
jgi:hypothetical protein